MITALIVSQILTWILLVAAIVAILALARQVGVLHERVAPAGALTPKQGPTVGGPAPKVRAYSLEGHHVDIGGALAPGKRRLILFVSSHCPVCKKLIPFAKSLARSEDVELIFAGDDREGAQRKLVETADLGGYHFLNDALLGRSFAVDKLPHAVLLGDDGTILSRGLVNSREHIESMFVSAETGLHSVQDYIETRKAQAAH
ncbi:MAG: methylamine utilization protein MauD [Sphingomonadales bacterium]|jgi:methylamine dehydrogenase accessory protein MauD|nr:methylamine utilization protein MauD [Sphingomonadales bacterium]MBK9268776.1 methylamine utilization protein MauD [Sphingomonadales bacterium]MCP5384198.1 methylamine utilization protein MauD [Altererythrobacter sp.]MCP5392918.1 methylamine utilization protein MauD [Sphingomonadaceae bacterium]